MNEIRKKKINVKRLIKINKFVEGEEFLWQQFPFGANFTLDAVLINWFCYDLDSNRRHPFRPLAL